MVQWRRVALRRAAPVYRVGGVVRLWEIFVAVISLQNVGKAFGAKPVLDGLSVGFECGERVGLVGANGAGKSTVLRIVAGREKPDGGVVHVARGLRLGYLPQEANFRSDRTLREALLVVFGDLREGAARLRALEGRLGERGANPAGWDPAVLEEYTDLLARFEERGGYTYEGRVEQVLGGLGFARELWDMPAATLSGGQRTRARLARLLLEEPDYLLLDEPTNHLDLETTEWLETFLAAWRRGLVVVSHDRYFLDKVTRRTVEVIDGKAESYPAPYSRYLYLRAERYRRQQKQSQAQRKEIAKAEEFIRRNGVGQRAREARGRQKRLDRVERIEGVPGRRDALAALRLGADTRSGEIALSTVRLRVGYPGKSLLALPNAQVARGERIALIGPNGAGKSTLLRTLVGELPPLGGSFAWGANVEVGYYAQGHEGLRRERTVLAEVQDARPMAEEDARRYLGRFLFSGDDVFKKVGDLSGGERSRVALARLTLRRANMLLLDEPTNHLDIAVRDALEGVLRDYDGTIVFVSHDRYFIDAVATTIWSAEGGVVRVFPGGYSAYLEARERGLPPAQTPDEADAPARPARARVSTQRTSRARDGGAARPLLGEVRDAEVAALVGAARTLEEGRQGLGGRLARLQGQTLDGLIGLAEEHARAQEELEASDERFLAAIRRHLQ